MENIKPKYREGLLVDWVEEAAGAHPEKIAYDFLGRKVSYKKFVSDIHTIAKGLIRMGVKENDCVSIALPNVPQSITFLYAVNKIGAVANMIHPLSSKDELLKYLNLVEAKYIIVFDEMYPKLLSVIKNTKLESVLVTGVKDALPVYKKPFYSITHKAFPKGVKAELPDSLKVVKYADFIKGAKRQSDEIELPDMRKRTKELAVILYSGGTTGKIKAVCLSNYAINACTMQMSLNSDIQPGDALLSIMPNFHGNGLIIGGHLIYVSAGKCVLVPRFSVSACTKLFRKHKFAHISGSPTLFEKLFFSSEWKRGELSFLKGVYCGSDFLSIKLEHKLDEFLKAHGAKIYVRQGYGMTECVAGCSINGDGVKKYGSVGKPFCGVDMKIVEPGTESELKPGQVGEIVISSQTNMMGYLNDPEETQNVLRLHSDGKKWIHSGDLGYVDEDGFFFFKGRIKRMIVTSGYNVFPAELEETIGNCDLVDKCFVVGKKDDVRVEKIKAFIKLNDGVEKNEMTLQTIKNYCMEHIARYAVPREFEFVEDFKTTRIGKVDFKYYGLK